MKWLLLVLLISCGKHTVPSAVDNRDSDGDQIPNHLEKQFNRYIADFEPIQELNGELSYSTPGFLLEEKIFKFSNTRDLHTETMNLMTLNEKVIKDLDLSFEWSPLWIGSETQGEPLADRLYSVRLRFSSPNEEPRTVAIFQNGTFKNLGTWKTEMNFNLTNQELDSLITKKSFLVVGKEILRHFYSESETVGKTVLEKTYRVYLSEDGRAKVFYVSKELSFTDFKKTMSINSTSNIDDLDLFFSNYSQFSTWWERQLPGGDRVLTKTTLSALRESFLKNLNPIRGKVTRENGSKNKTVRLQKKATSRIYLNIRVNQFMRTFKEHMDPQFNVMSSPSGSTKIWYCYDYKRNIESEFPVPIEINEALNHLKIRTKSQNFNAKDLIQELVVKNDQEGIFYQTVLNVADEDLELFVEDLPRNTFVITGVYHKRCDRGHDVKGKISDVQTNSESKLSFSIEAFVENLD